MARWGLIPFWMKESPRSLTSRLALRRCTNCRCFERLLLNSDVSYRRRDFTSGRSAKIASSLIASVEKTSNLSPSRECGSLHDWVGEQILSTAMIVGGDQANHHSPPTSASRAYDHATTGIDDLKATLKPYDAALMEAYAVNSAVNSVKNDSEECIEPVAD